MILNNISRIELSGSCGANTLAGALFWFLDEYDSYYDDNVIIEDIQVEEDCADYFFGYCDYDGRRFTVKMYDNVLYFSY